MKTFIKIAVAFTIAMFASGTSAQTAISTSDQYKLCDIATVLTKETTRTFHEKHSTHTVQWMIDDVRHRLLLVAVKDVTSKAEYDNVRAIVNKASEVSTIWIKDRLYELDGSPDLVGSKFKEFCYDAVQQNAKKKGT